MSLLRILMPPRARLAGQAVSPVLGKALARADENTGTEQRAGGESEALRAWRAPLHRAFDILPRGLPVAALTRAVDAPGDAEGAWLRADPAFVRADMATGRLMAWSELGISAAEAQALIAPLRPLFGDEGLLLDAPHPARWYLRLPERAELPAFPDPQDAMGDDLREHLPQGAQGRRWLRLLTEAQVLLHNHPLNLERQRRGQAPVNSLWFWGAGARPHQVATRFVSVQSDEPLLRALAVAAGAALPPPAARYAAGEGDQLLDLRGALPASLHADWLLPALAALGAGGLSAIELDFPDAAGMRLLRAQRWRFWRRAWSAWA